MEFTVPGDIAELMDGSSGCFQVQDEYDMSSMSTSDQDRHLEGIKQALRGKDHTAILSNDVFDPLLGFARSFMSLDAEVKSQVWSSLHNGMSTLSAYLSVSLEELQAASTEGSEARNSVKMLMFLLNHICLLEESEAAKATKHVSKKKKQVTNSRWDWSLQRLRAVTAMGRLLQLDVCRLWPMSCPEEPFVNLFTRTAYVLLETPSVVKDKATKEDIFQLLGILVQRYNHALGAATSIVHSLPHFEHLATPMAQLLETFVNSYDGSRVVAEVLREIGRLDPKGLTRDTSGTKNYATFLTELGERVPGTVLQSLALILPLLDGESYVMRQAILTTAGSIICFLMPDKTESAVDARDQLLEILTQRIHDTNAFARSKTLQVWQKLVDAKAVPLLTLKRVVPLFAERLGDKSSTVRKNALVLLTNLVSVNPYGAHMSVTELSKSLKIEQAKLAELTGEPMNTEEDDATPKPEAASAETDPAVKEEPESEDSAESEAEEAEEKVSKDQEGSDDEEEKEAEAEAEEEEEEEEEIILTAEEAAKEAEIKSQRVLIQFISDWKTFAEAIEGVVPTACQLLGSTNISDVTSGVEFFVTMTEFGVDNAIVGVRKMLALMWAKETAAKDCAIEAYKKLYLNPDPALHPTAKAQAAAIVKNLISLTLGANLGDLTSLEELVCTMMKQDLITPGVLRVLWDVFAMKISSSEQRSHGALKIIGMIAGASADIVKDNVGLLMSIGLGERAMGDMVLFRDTCAALQKLVKKKGRSDDAPERFASDHALFPAILNVLTNCAPNITQGWFPGAEQAINTIYLLAEHPDMICEGLIRKLTSHVFDKNGQESCNSNTLARLLFVVGHVALKQLVHLENIEVELKRRHGIEDDRSEKSKHSKQNDDDDMGVGGASAEDAEAEFIASISENELVMGSGLLARYAPLLLAVVKNPAKYPAIGLQSAAVVSLCKYMCASPKFCDDNLQLLFTVMETSKEPTIRSNAMIALGDLAFRFPNLIEPWTAHLYSRLRDPEARVRKNTLMVLTHLILNDMIKVKGQISEMAICMEDKEQRISDLARLFFHELAHKGNAIYNLLPDIISQVSSPASGMSPAQFRNIMANLFAYIKLERQAESLIDKLCQRFRTTTDVQQWRHFAHCLSLLQLSERGAKKLIEHFPCYADKLSDVEIYQSFTEIMAKGRKFAKQDLKDAVAELEVKIQACHEKGAEAAETAAKAKKVAGRARKYRSKIPLEEQQDNVAESKPQAAKKKKKVVRKKKAVESSSEDEDLALEDSTDDLLSGEENAAPLPQKATTRRARGPRRRVAVHDSDDSDFDI